MSVPAERLDDLRQRGWLQVTPLLAGAPVEGAAPGRAHRCERVREVVKGDDGRSYVVVDTGWWIFEKKRLIPAGAIAAIDHEDRKVNVSLTKDEIRHAPDYEAERRDDKDVRDNHEDYYSPYASSRR